MDLKLSVGIDASFQKPNRNKGQSLIAFPDDYVVIDIETTGLDYRFDAIIEVSAIRYINNNYVDSFTSLIKPNGYFLLDDFITELTGITEDMLSCAPSTEDVLNDFFTFIGDSVIIGHNVNFDINFLYDNRMMYFDTPFLNDYIDTMRLSRRILKELSHHRLCDLISYYNLNDSQQHRAETDCHFTNLIFQNLKQEVSNKFTDFESFYKYCKHGFKAKDICKTNDFTDIDNPLYGKLCVFTGKLERMPRKEAMQLVVNIGGFVSDTINKKTNYLILGNNDYCSSIKDGKSNKQKKAESLKLSGQDIEIISENTFYDLVSYNS